jgi:hypothetical protein
LLRSFDWTDERDKQTRHISVKAGDVITASVSYEKSGNGR